MRGLERPTPFAPADLEDRTAQQVLSHMVEEHHPRVAMACSFQKEEAVLLDMLLAIEPEARVFMIDTGVLFAETYATWREVERRYGVKVEVHDALDPEGRPWTARRCCGERKVEALRGALSGLDGWITGLRREQSHTRAQAPKLGWDEAHGLWKANPLADWTERQVWAYLAEHDLPYNPLHDRGYASIGCAPCTQPGSGREGRWAGERKTECGIHAS